MKTCVIFSRIFDDAHTEVHGFFKDQTVHSIVCLYPCSPNSRFLSPRWQSIIYNGCHLNRSSIVIQILQVILIQRISSIGESFSSKNSWFLLPLIALVALQLRNRFKNFNSSKHEDASYYVLTSDLLEKRRTTFSKLLILKVILNSTTIINSSEPLETKSPTTPLPPLPPLERSFVVFRTVEFLVTIPYHCLMCLTSRIYYRPLRTQS